MKRDGKNKNFILRFFSIITIVFFMLSSTAVVSAADIESDGEDSASVADEPQAPQKTSLPDNTMETQAEVFIEETTPAAEADSDEMTIEPDLVDAPPIIPEGSAADNNIHGVAGMYYVTVPKHMAFRKLPNGDYETVESSRYTVNSALDNSYQLSVRVSGINTDDTVQLSDEADRVHRKVEVSTMAYDVWKYRPDGTRLTVNEADELGYGKELVLEGPGKFYAKCRLSQFGDDRIHAGTWTGSILFTVSCTPEPEISATEDEDASSDGDTEETSETAEQTNDGEEGQGTSSASSASRSTTNSTASSPSTGSVAASRTVATTPSVQQAATETISQTADDTDVTADDDAKVSDSFDIEDDEPVLEDGALIDISQIEPEEDLKEGTSETSSEDLGSAYQE